MGCSEIFLRRQSHNQLVAPTCSQGRWSPSPASRCASSMSLCPFFPGCPGFSLSVSLTLSHCLPFSVAPRFSLSPIWALQTPVLSPTGLLLEEPRRLGLRALPPHFQADMVGQISHQEETWVSLQLQPFPARGSGLWKWTKPMFRKEGGWGLILF